MLPGKLLITGVLVALIAVGCVQKKPQSRKTTSQTKTISKPVMKDSTDIFDEFYKDEAGNANGKQTSEQSVKSSTFSTSPTRSAASGQMSEDGKYVLQVSTVKSKRLADKVASQLGNKGIPAYVVQVENPTPQLSGTYYRIRIGGFASIGSAKSFGENSLRTAGFEFWVDKKSNDNVGAEGYGFGGGASYSGSSSSSYNSSSSSGNFSTPQPEAAPSYTPSAESNGSAASNSSAVTPVPAAAGSSAPPAADGKKLPDTTGWGNAW